MTRAERARLYLTAPPELASGALAPADFAGTLLAAIAAGDVACLLLAAAGKAGSTRPDALVEPIVRPVQDRGVAVLVEDDGELALAVDADGVHLRGDGGAARRIRARLGGDAVVGVACGRSRHQAMLAGEAGADYVAFHGRESDPEGPADPELLAWCQEVMTVPCVAMGRVGLDDVGALAAAGADFIALGEAVWRHGEGAAAAVAAAQRAIERAGP